MIENNTKKLTRKCRALAFGDFGVVRAVTLVELKPKGWHKLKGLRKWGFQERKILRKWSEVAAACIRTAPLYRDPHR